MQAEAPRPDDGDDSWRNKDIWDVFDDFDEEYTDQRIAEMQDKFERYKENNRFLNRAMAVAGLFSLSGVTLAVVAESETFQDAVRVGGACFAGGSLLMGVLAGISKVEERRAHRQFVEGKDL